MSVAPEVDVRDLDSVTERNPGEMGYRLIWNSLSDRESTALTWPFTVYLTTHQWILQHSDSNRTATRERKTSP